VFHQGVDAQNKKIRPRTGLKFKQNRYLCRLQKLNDQNPVP
jgi:hypothetical protein